MSKQRSFKYVKYLWQDEVARELRGVDRLVYRSNKLVHAAVLNIPMKAPADTPCPDTSAT